jgi:hypothetical protein
MDHFALFVHHAYAHLRFEAGCPWCYPPAPAPPEPPWNLIKDITLTGGRT